MRRAYYTLDVFTDAPLAGNPLAVVLDSQGLDDAPHAGDRRANSIWPRRCSCASPSTPSTPRLYAFSRRGANCRSPAIPTVGTAVLLAHLRARDLLSTQDLRVVLEENVGEVVCIARHRRGQAMAAYFHLPRLPRAAWARRRDRLLARRRSRPRVRRHRL